MRDAGAAETRRAGAARLTVAKALLVVLRIQHKKDAE